MAQTNSKFFSVMVVGNNPREIMEKYDSNKEVEPYVKYKYLEAKKYKSVAVKAMEKIVKENDKINLPANIKERLVNRLKAIKSETDFEYYRELTDGMFYDENGNALSEENPDGKWVTCRDAGHFAMPLKTKDNKETYSTTKGNVDWDAIHHTDSEIYEAAWEVVVDGREPNNDREKQIYESMKDKMAYFLNFKSKKDYVNYATSYWNYAFVNEDGWKDADNYSNGDLNEWINNFYDDFIVPLKDDDLITIFECTTNNG